MENPKREVGNIAYKLVGAYSYNEVIALNQLTGIRRGEKFFKRYCTFGYCQEIGNIAFIGIINSTCCTKFGSFKCYKTSPERTLGFKLYSDEEAKQITDYTVYGLEGAQAISAKMPIEKIDKDIRLMYFP